MRVEDIAYPGSRVQFTMTTALDINEANGITLTDADRASLAEESLMWHVDIGILEMKPENRLKKIISTTALRP